MNAKWPENGWFQQIVPSRTERTFLVNGKFYQAFDAYGLVEKSDRFLIVSLYRSGGSFYYDTGVKGQTIDRSAPNAAAGVTANIMPGGGTFMALYPRKYAVLSTYGRASAVTTAQIAKLKSNSTRSTNFLRHYYSTLIKTDNLLRNPAHVEKAMKEIQLAVSRDNFLNRGLTDTAFAIKVRDVLLATGFPKNKVDAFLKIKPSAALRGGGGSDGDGSGSDGGTGNPSEQRVVVRAPFGYIQPPVSIDGSRPTLVQRYPTASNLLPVDNTATPNQSYATEIFTFPYIPNNIQYQGSGSEWVEIPRAADFPIVEWARWQLLKISMDFLIATDRLEDPATGKRVPDGIFNSVSDQIEKLRRMAQRPYPVSVFNMDKFFSIALRRAELTGKPMEFVISDFSWTATRRTMGTDGSEISVASCRLTLQEAPIESVSVFRFDIPVLAPKKTPKKASDPNDSNKDTGKISEITYPYADTMKTNSPGSMPTSPSGRTVAGSN